MTDLVERLRSPCSHNDGQRQRREAADQIERLQEEIKQLRFTLVVRPLPGDEQFG